MNIFINLEGRKEKVTGNSRCDGIGESKRTGEFEDNKTQDKTRIRQRTLESTSTSIYRICIRRKALRD